MLRALRRLEFTLTTLGLLPLPLFLGLPPLALSLLRTLDRLCIGLLVVGVVRWERGYRQRHLITSFSLPARAVIRSPRFTQAVTDRLRRREAKGAVAERFRREHLFHLFHLFRFA